MKTFPKTLVSTSDETWTLADDLTNAIKVNYAQYRDKHGRSAYSKGGRVLYSIQITEDWMLIPGCKIADVKESADASPRLKAGDFRLTSAI